MSEKDVPVSHSGAICAWCGNYLDTQVSTYDPFTYDTPAGSVHHRYIGDCIKGLQLQVLDLYNNVGAPPPSKKLEDDKQKQKQPAQQDPSY